MRLCRSSCSLSALCPRIYPTAATSSEEKCNYRDHLSAEIKPQQTTANHFPKLNLVVRYLTKRATVNIQSRNQPTQLLLTIKKRPHPPLSLERRLITYPVEIEAHLHSRTPTRPESSPADSGRSRVVAKTPCAASAPIRDSLHRCRAQSPGL